MSKELDSGIYNLIIKLDSDQQIEVGSLGKLEFKSGYYIYTGTAQRNLTARIERHQSNDKKLHWHIDYLLQFGEVIDVALWSGSKELECQLHQFLLNNCSVKELVAEFGASDCQCNTHLLYSREIPNLTDDREIKKFVEQKGR
ncbi:MAG: GIY-YIG nuclease family protein [Bacillota bacterium]